MLDSKLQYLSEAAKIGSMRGASEKLGVAVSSISRQIAQLELELGMPLIEHGRRTVKLTEAGEAAVGYYRERHSQYETFIGRLKDLKGVRTGRIELAIGEGFVSDAFSHVLAGFMAEHPGVTVNVTVAGSIDVMGYVAEDEAHLGLVFHAPPDPKIRVRASVPQPIKLLAAPGHPLASRPSISLSELEGHRLCLPSKSFRISQLLGLALSNNPVGLTEATTSNSMGMLKVLSETGAFVTLLPELAAVSEIAEGRLVAIPVENSVLQETTVSLVSRMARQLPFAAARLLSILEVSLRGWSERPPQAPELSEAAA